VPQPDPDGGELDGCEEIVVSFVVTGCDGTKVFEFVEEAFDQIAVAIEKWAERRDIFCGSAWV
jgi:hypothetical protein